MSAEPKPKRPQPKGGSRKGIPNKVSKAVKDMVKEAFERAGGVEYLVEQAEANPKAFMSMVSRLIPVEVANPEGEAFKVEAVVRKIVDVA